MNGLSAALAQLRQALDDVHLPLPLPDQERVTRACSGMRNQLDDYILPRLATLDAPLLVVVGGSTGAGKSTLVNSLIGRRVTTPGVIRPTTRSPVLVHHPDDADWFTADRILPGLARSSTETHDHHTVRLVPEASLPTGLAILDTPDVDSVVAENRDLAAQLLAAGDLWLFVTSAARYADAVPWQFLREAARRSAVVAVVLDRVPPEGMAEIPPHLGQLLTDQGLGDAPLFAVPETRTDDEGLLPDSAVSPIRGWLVRLAADREGREAVVRRTLAGAIGDVVDRGDDVVRALTDQEHTMDQLRAEADLAYLEAVRQISVQSADGSLMRGEVLNRWHEFIGTGEIFRKVEQGVGRMRDRIVSWIRGRPVDSEDLQVAVESGLEALIIEEGAAAAERAHHAWRSHVAGRFVVGDDLTLARPSPEFSDRAASVIRHWQADVMELVSGEGVSKRSRARFLALGVNAVGVALMILVFSQTGGLVGAEVGVAGGTAVVAQRLLEAVFGDDAVRRLARRAKEELDDRVQGLMASELARYHRAIDTLGFVPGAADGVREALHAVRVERRDARWEVTPAPQALPPQGTTALGAGERPSILPATADQPQIVEAEIIEEKR